MALFRSPHKGFVQKVRSSAAKYHPITGVEIDRIPSLRAEFGIFGAEQSFVNPETGEHSTAADIRGGFFDSAEAQKTHGWSDDERETVDTVLRRICRERPDYVQEVVAVHVPAPLPWATYGQSDAVEAAEFAVKLGLVPETLRFERENLNRPVVIEALESALLEMPEEAWDRAESRTEIPAEQLTEMDPHGVSIGAAPVMTESGIVKGTPGLVLNPATITL